MVAQFDKHIFVKNKFKVLLCVTRNEQRRLLGTRTSRNCFRAKIYTFKECKEWKMKKEKKKFLTEKCKTFGELHHFAFKWRIF